MKPLPPVVAYGVIEESRNAGAAGYIWNRWDDIFPERFRRIDREHCVYGSVMVLDDETKGWRIDYLADFQGKRYIVECDVNESATGIWHGFKVFGYRAAYCIDRVEKTSNIGMMMFFHDRLYTHRVRNILSVAGIEYCTFVEDGDDWKLVKKSLWR
jgi:hypothetical protein